MTDRVQRLKSRMISKGNHISVEKFRLMCEAEKMYHGEPNMMVRAKTMAHTLRQMPVYILPDELIVGAPASKPWGYELDTTLGVWDSDEAQALRDDGYIFSKEDEELMLKLNEEFEPFSMYSGANLIVAPNKKFDDFVQTGMCLGPWKPNDPKSRKGRMGGGLVAAGLGLGPGWTLLCIDYELPIYTGFEELIRRADECLQKNTYYDPKSFDRGIGYESMKIVLQAAIDFAERYAVLAEEMAEKETDPQRKRELLEIAETCHRVPAKPARTFREAMQCLWFCFIMMSPCATTPIGRFDQYMYPLYKADIEAGRITDEEVIELLDIFRIRCNELDSQGGREQRKRASGGARWYNMTIGGVKPDGSDATNELSYLILDAVLDTKIPHHTVTIRVADSTPAELLRKGVECQAKGMSMPAFTNDKSYIGFFSSPNLSDPGLPLEVARDYCMTGCIDGNIPGVTRSMSVSMFVGTLVLDVFLHNGVCTRNGIKIGHDVDLASLNSFDEFFDAFKKEFAYFIDIAAQKNNIENDVMRTQCADPFRSALMKGGVESGLEVCQRRFDFENSSLLNAVGFINLGQSIYAIKKACYEDKVCTLPEMLKALDDNWEGHEELHEYCKGLPYYGNDVDEVDEIIAAVYKFYHDEVVTHPTTYGGYTRCNMISVSAHSPGGALTCATPDGRRKGEILADANLSPIQGTDKNGPLCVFRSAMKVDQQDFQAFLLNMKFHPSALKTPEDYDKLVAAIKVYFAGGGKMVQFNVVDADTLKRAQLDPESHKDLMVRIAGYSAYFVNLNESVQNDIMRRTEQQF